MGDGETPQVLYEVRGPAAWLTLNRPKRRNALGPEAVEELLALLGRAAADPAARVVVLTGAGDRAFCAGGDLGRMSPADGRVAEHERRGRFAALLTAMADHPTPIVARVNGMALGGGFGLALGCDLVVASDAAQFGTPEVDIGLWPFMITAIIQRNLPRKLAVELMLTGRRLPAAEAERWGLVNRLVPPDALDQAVGELVETLAAKSPLVLRLGRQSFHRAQDMPFEDALAYLGAMLTVALESEDVAEGVSAFLQERPPEWKGR
ncbi:MAG TPA: enoyl-CoA hydratase-related protein [Actinomycetota bacterium]|nr:enoyl-CoA hydratase-related protein [Actinomycetota bacterium]